MKCQSCLICFYVWYVLNKTSYKYCSLYIPGAHFSKQFQPVGKWNRTIVLFDLITNYNAEGNGPIEFLCCLLTAETFSAVLLSLKALISSQCVAWKSCVALNKLFFNSFKIDQSGIKHFVLV